MPGPHSPPGPHPIPGPMPGPHSPPGPQPVAPGGPNTHSWNRFGPRGRMNLAAMMADEPSVASRAAMERSVGSQAAAPASNPDPEGERKTSLDRAPLQLSAAI